MQSSLPSCVLPRVLSASRFPSARPCRLAWRQRCRQISGRTVVEFLNEALAAEAALRLKTTSRTITQMADDFNFSDQAAFTKFFTRMKGMSPKEYRKG